VGLGLPTVVQTWTMSFNNRYVWNTSTSTNVAEMGAFAFSLFGVGGFLTSTMGYTVKGSCDGTTGAMDGTNRITAATKWATRNNGSAGAQCWIVLADGAGINWCFSYNSASDGTLRLAHSTGGNYVAAGTPSNQPTATDECFDSASSDWVITATLGSRFDQVWHLWGSSDKKMFRICTCSFTGVQADGTSFNSYIAGEKFTSALASPATFTLTTGGGTVGAVKTYYTATNGSTGHLYTWNANFNTAYSVTLGGDICRVNNGSADGNAKTSAGCEYPGGSPNNTNGAWNIDYPALQGRNGYTIFPVEMGSITASFDGKLGNRIDQWCLLTSTNSPAFGTMLGNAQFWVVHPIAVLVGDGSTVMELG